MEKKTKRRDFLFTATYAVGAVGAGAVIWPMIDQMNPDASVKALASTEVDVSAVILGKPLLCCGLENQFLLEEELKKKLLRLNQ